MATRWVFHMDLDQFIAAVEMLRRPELEGLPIVVGGDGDPTKRGVVSTANYHARAFGIRSGMALRTALKRCPEAVFLPVDAEAYLAASREVMDTLRTFPAVVQVAGWDEAFMGVESDDPEALARRVQGTVHERTRLWCSIGVGDNKLRAKIASGFAKPQGVYRLTRSNWSEVMGGRPTDALFGIGKKTAAKLSELGIRTAAELAAAAEDVLTERFGPRTGPWLRAIANGEGETEVSDEPYLARGHGKERTFQRDLSEPEEIRRHTASLARELAAELASEGREAVRVVVKVRFAPFSTSTRGVRLPGSTLDADAIERAALEALGRFELDRPVRLLGVRAELAEPEFEYRRRPWIPDPLGATGEDPERPPMSRARAVRVPLWLDHASVQVPELAPAVEHLDRRLGLRATVSPAAPDRHGRVRLDRSYLEVTARPGGTGWSATLFFLRFEDPAALRVCLEAAGLAYRFGEYEGVDGTWDDVVIEAGTVPLPILVRRTAPLEVARDWPPALAEPHWCGARSLAEVHVGVPSLRAALEAYARLLGLDRTPEPIADPRSSRPRVGLSSASGRIVLLEGGTGKVERIVLGVASLDAVRRMHGDRLFERVGDPVAWLDPSETFGLELGFILV